MSACIIEASSDVAVQNWSSNPFNHLCRSESIFSSSESCKMFFHFFVDTLIQAKLRAAIRAQNEHVTGDEEFPTRREHTSMLLIVSSMLTPRGPQRGCNFVHLACNPSVIRLNFVLCNLDLVNTIP